MKGYWDDEKNTRKTLTEDGWLKTGDQFVLGSDGYGQIVGRLKDMLIRGGENIFPKVRIRREGNYSFVIAEKRSLFGEGTG